MGDDAAASHRRLSHLFHPGRGIVVLHRNVEAKENHRQRSTGGVGSAQLILLGASKGPAFWRPVTTLHQDGAWFRKPLLRESTRGHAQRIRVRLKRIDSRRRFRCNAVHGDYAISPRGDMPKYRVPYLLRGRIHVISHNDIPRQAFTTDRHGENARPDRRSYRRGFRRRPAADSRLDQTQPSGCRRLGRGIFRPLSHRRLPARRRSSRRAPRPGCGSST